MLNRTIRIASTSTSRKMHGALISKGGRVLSVGINTDRNFCLNVSNPKKDASEHAESAAIRACGDPEGATIFSARVNRQGRTGLALPCENCMFEIEMAKIKKIIYTN